jgi:hypothetical protein
VCKRWVLYLLLELVLSRYGLLRPELKRKDAVRLLQQRIQHAT